MTDLIEKAAKVYFEDFYDGLIMWSEMPGGNFQRARNLDAMRAALAALREPSFEMLESGAWPDDDPLGVYAADDMPAADAHRDLRVRWQAMIDALLAETEKTGDDVTGCADDQVWADVDADALRSAADNLAETEKTDG